MNFQIDEGSTPKIKVIGVGGGGSNAVQNMVRSEMQGVQFIVANTDAQHLATMEASVRLQLGEKLTRGLGAGSNPTKGRDAAQESMEQIREVLKGADMVFIAAGMGGGTGSGAAPVIAQIAKEENALTVGVVTRPFFFEGPQRAAVASKAIEELKQHVDSLVVVPNDRLVALSQKNSPFVEMLKQADDVLRFAVQGIVDVINKPGYISVDFADVTTVMSKTGLAVMGIGVASGEKRAHDASMRAISSPFLEVVGIAGAQAVLVNITSNRSITMTEISDAYDIVIKAVGREDAMVLVGNVFDDNVGDEIQVTVVATGIQDKQQEASESRVQRSIGVRPSVEAVDIKVPRGGTIYTERSSEQHHDQYDIGYDTNRIYRGGNYTDADQDMHMHRIRPNNLGYFKERRASDESIPTFLRNGKSNPDSLE